MQQRRDFLRDGLRWSGLAAIGGMATWLGVHSMRSDCAREHPCGACPLFDGCGLPKAGAAKTQPQSTGAADETRRRPTDA